MFTTAIVTVFAIIGVAYVISNARKFAADWQRKRNAQAYKRFAQGVRDLEASMQADGTWKA